MNLANFFFGLLLGVVVGAGAIYVEKVKPDAAASEATEVAADQLRAQLAEAKGEADILRSREKEGKAALAKALDEAGKLREDNRKVAKTSGAKADTPAEAPAPDPAATSADAAATQQANLLRAIVLIKGDNAQGTGFLVKTETGPVVVTNIHVLFNNPNCQVTTSSGAKIKLGSLKGATDRDLAMIGIEDDGYTYLEPSKDVSHETKIGDALVTPGNSDGGEVILPTNGKLLAVGSDRVEFDNPIYHGNSGGPVFDGVANKVIGVVTQAMKVSNTSEIDKASFSSSNSAIKGSMRYFGFRLDTVPKWEDYDWGSFQTETADIDAFHNRSLALHSYLNGNEKTSGSEKTGGIDPNYYQTDDQLRTAQVDFRSRVGHTTNEMSHTRAVNDLLVVLRNIADTGVDAMRQRRFYAFNQLRMQDELKFRDELKKEIDQITESFDRQ